MMNDAIETNHLSRHFGAVKAVENMDLVVPKGIVFGFLGPNGAGKTTTIRLLLGLLEPTQGSARVLGLDTQTQAEYIRVKCGALLEHTGLYERLTAEENLEYYTRIWHLPRTQSRDRIKELLTHLGLYDRRKEPVSRWSRGMKQKLAVARALLHKPELLFLDEPTAGLDPVAAAALRDDLASLAHREGVTVFLTTHNLAEAEKLCQQVGVIRQGRLLATGSVAEMRATSSKPRLELIGRGLDDKVISLLQARPEVSAVHSAPDRLMVELYQPVDTAPLVSLVVGTGAQVEEVHKGQSSLEDVFITLMQEEA
jgi:ABC-2 type transport system ATP-binding protein